MNSAHREHILMNSAQYDLMDDLLHADMFKVLSDMVRSESLLIQRGKAAKFG